jgi:hypothetical protein
VTSTSNDDGGGPFAGAGLFDGGATTRPAHAEMNAIDRRSTLAGGLHPNNRASMQARESTARQAAGAECSNKSPSVTVGAIICCNATGA